jgi:hypothetical protein
MVTDEKYRKLEGSKMNISLVYQAPKDNEDKAGAAQVYEQVSHKIAL